MRTSKLLSTFISLRNRPSQPVLPIRLALLITLTVLSILLPTPLPTQAQTSSSASWRTFTTADGLADNRVLSIYQDDEGALWFGTNGNGVSRYQSGQWQTLATNSLANYLVQAIYQDGDGALWFSTSGNGVSRYQDGMWRTFTTTDGLASNGVQAITQDSEGALWFGTWDDGVSRYQGGRWHTFSTTNGLASNSVQTITQDTEGAMWFGTAIGVSRYQGGQWQSFTTADGLISNGVQAIIQDGEGALWFGTSEGISRYHGGRWQSFTTTDGLADNDVRAIYQDDKGGIWFGTAKGVSRYLGGKWQTFTVANGLADNSVLAITQDHEGALWFGTWGGGVSRYQGGRRQTFTTTDGLAGHDVRAITQDGEGSLWFGTSERISRYQGRRWQTFTIAASRAGNDIRAIAQDREGALWFGTWGGVSRYQGGRWQTFTTDDGLAFDVRAIYQDGEGVLWFGTENWGVSRYRPGIMPPGVWLTSVYGQSYTGGGPLSLSPGANRLTVTFEGGDAATRTEELLYVYRLVGLWEEWTNTDQPFAVYRDLSPGRYTFQVKALDQDGNFSKPAEVEIIIPQPPLTATPQITLYGYSLVGLAGLAVTIVSFNHWREQRRTRRAIARKENPYIANVPVKDPKMFFGRDDTLRQILNGIHQNNFAVCGPKRIGKTSLLHQVEAALPKVEDAPYALRPVMLSLHGVAEAEFFQTLGEAIVAQARPEKTSLSLPSHDHQATYNRYDFLTDLDTLRDAWQAASAKPVRLVLLIDEGDVLNEYSQRTLAQLRYVFMGPGLGFLSMVWTGETLDQRPWTLPGSDWLTVFGEVFYLTPLIEAEAIRLIQEPAPYYRYDKEAVRLILDESQLIPHRIQLLCRAAIEEMLKEGRGRIKVKDVEAASRTLTSLPYRVAPMTDMEAKKQLAETRPEYQAEPEDEDAE